MVHAGRLLAFAHQMATSQRIDDWEAVNGVSDHLHALPTFSLSWDAFWEEIRVALEPLWQTLLDRLELAMTSGDISLPSFPVP